MPLAKSTKRASMMYGTARWSADELNIKAYLDNGRSMPVCPQILTSPERASSPPSARALPASQGIPARSTALPTRTTCPSVSASCSSQLAPRLQDVVGLSVRAALAQLPEEERAPQDNWPYC